MENAKIPNSGRYHVRHGVTSQFGFTLLSKLVGGPFCPFSLISFFVSLSHSQGTLVVVQENREKKQECFYLFELDSSAICPVIESKLSTGSILLIMCVKTVCNDTAAPSVRTYNEMITRFLSLLF